MERDGEINQAIVKIFKYFVNQFT